ncbi:2-amino-4-hydroxy-6-hydroxymethyldihydropteridine diphosphokinase [Cellulomonas rhizosphaerae]|uniref:Bifunctional folate synthesis protein n=1 Tax=Cellulomonas rhizosphaerae TaxID=2293719 RepID=A0A413RNS8_9CELL|nr:2-amino-4-hydroxy-6-hydroxymethyldihydropteridine diphosphokinase [Cellulomonas rhizosphaerae]
MVDDQRRRLDQIRLTGITATGYHGVFEHERREGQTFVADVVVHLDTRRAAARDDLAHTLNYGELALQVSAVLSGEPVDLIETVAERIAATVLAHAIVQAVDVAVHKPQAPIEVPFGDVVVAVRRDRTKLPAAEPYVAQAPALPAAAVPTATAALPVALPAAPNPSAPVMVAPAPTGALPTGVTPSSPSGPVAATPVAPGPAGPSPVDGELVVDAFDRTPDAPVDVVLALGSNLGAPQDTLRRAVGDLGAIPGVQVVDVSPLARTAPVGGPEQPDFLNAVVLARTSLSARDLLRATQSVEQAHGRERHEHWGPRTLDVDIIVYGGLTAVSDDLEVPHPRAHERAFVLQPWAQVAPDAVLPGLGGGPVAVLAATAPDREGVRWLALDWLTAPVPAASPDPAGDLGGSVQPA